MAGGRQSLRHKAVKLSRAWAHLVKVPYIRLIGDDFTLRRRVMAGRR